MSDYKNPRRGLMASDALLGLDLDAVLEGCESVPVAEAGCRESQWLRNERDVDRIAELTQAIRNDDAERKAQITEVRRQGHLRSFARSPHQLSRSGRGGFAVVEGVWGRRWLRVTGAS